IIIKGNTRTPDRVIRDTVALLPGEVLSYPALQTARKKLARLGVISLTVLDNGDSEFKDLLVTVKEAETPALVPGGTWSDAALDLCYTRSASFRIPFQLSPDGPRVKQVKLYVSEDAGRTYRLAAEAAPDEKGFTYEAGRDGVHWFTVQVVDE